MTTFDATRAAKVLADAHTNRTAFENLSGATAPSGIDQAYEIQEALSDIWVAHKGPVAGLKIATTTKVMQALMGIDHPCGGMIFKKTIRTSPATLASGEFMHAVIECELAVRMARDLPHRDTPYSSADVRAAVGNVMAAYEIIEDRNAVYKETDAKTLIADNAWNGGIVLGPEQTVPADKDLNGILGRLTKNGAPAGEGKTDDPMGALAWVANLAATRGRPLKAGMVVITGSVIPTFALADGDHITFELEGIGKTEMTFSGT